MNPVFVQSVIEELIVFLVGIGTGIMSYFLFRPLADEIRVRRACLDCPFFIQIMPKEKLGICGYSDPSLCKWNVERNKCLFRYNLPDEMVGPPNYYLVDSVTWKPILDNLKEVSKRIGKKSVNV